VGVQQSPDPISLTASSMLSGGSVEAALKSKLESSAPGSAGAAPDPVAQQVGDQHQPEPTSSTAGTSSEVLGPNASVAAPQLPARHPVTGRFTTAKDASGMWRLTPSSRA
jgi:hypothetical protein